MKSSIPTPDGTISSARSQSGPRSRSRKPLSWTTERLHWKNGIHTIFGVDEAGRGPLAGPVVAAAVCFDYDTCRKWPAALHGIHDSKQLTLAERERYFDAVLDHARATGIGIVGREEIDSINILQATMNAMTIAVDGAARQCAAEDLSPQLLLIDGNYFRTTLPYEFQTIVDGDARSPLIAAASVLAKVTRDRIMIELDAVYPQYNFKSHKGYGTPEHLRLLREYGPCPEHRRSFRPDRFLQAELGFEIVTSPSEILPPLPE